MLGKRLFTLLTPAVLALLLAGAAEAKERRMTLEIESAEGDGIRLTFDGDWLREALLDAVADSIDCDASVDRDTRRMLLHLRERGEGSSYTLRDGDETTRARRRDGKLELRKHQKGEEPTEVVMPWAMGECMLGNEVPLRELGEAFEISIEKDGGLSFKIE